MLTRLSLGGLTAAFLIGAATPPTAARPDEPPDPNADELPRTWKLEQIAAGTPGSGGRVYPLAWAVRQDGRPYRVQDCLALRVLDHDSDRGRWCLVHLYWRAATSDSLGFKSPAGWRVGSFFAAYLDKDGRLWDRPGLNLKWFKARPGNREVYAALVQGEVDWDFELRDGWALVAGGVCEGNWKVAVGEQPTRFFGKASPAAGRK